MYPHELKVGKILLGNAGQVREILVIQKTRVKYRLLSAGHTKTRPAPAPESIRWCELQTLATWAQKEIPRSLAPHTTLAQARRSDPPQCDGPTASPCTPYKAENHSQVAS